jgi:hypothetical protein
MRKDNIEKETLYDAFLKCLPNKEFKTKEDYIAFKGAEFGAKWQKENQGNLYTEEQVRKILKRQVLFYKTYNI